MSRLSLFRNTASRWLSREVRKSGKVIWRALIKYDETDGEQRAASFAYYAFFALFPLMVLLITVFTSFLGNRKEASTRIISAVQEFLPLDQNASAQVINTIEGVVNSRSSAGFIAFGVLAWSALRFFQALVRGVNRAWGTREYSWWRLPIKNLFMTAILASALLLGIVLPAILNNIEYLYWKHSWEFGLDFLFLKDVFFTLRAITKYLVPPLVLFYGFAMFYKFAPQRRTAFREVWLAALGVTLGLHALKAAFVLYTTNIGNLNAVYGTLGSVVALLLWIYLSGSLIILGGCLCAARYEIEMSLADQSESHRAR